MTRYVGYRDGGKTNEEGLSRQLLRLNSAGVATSYLATSLEVTQRAAGANMSVDIAPGDAHIAKTDYSFWAWSDATENKTVATADGTNPRIDAVVAFIDLSVVDDTDNNNPDALDFKVVTGTPAGSPTAPNDSAIQASVGAGNPWVRLATIAVAAGASTIVDANITDARTVISSVVPPPSNSVGTSQLKNSSVTSDKLATNSVTPDKLNLGIEGTEPTAATVGTTTSTTYVTSLTTTGALPSVTATVPASGQVLVILQGVVANSTAEARSNLTYSLSGANTLTALANSDTDNRYITNRETNSNGSTVNGVWLHTGLTAGSTTFQVNARVQLGTGQFSAIHIIVIPLG